MSFPSLDLLCHVAGGDQPAEAWALGFVDPITPINNACVNLSLELSLSFLSDLSVCGRVVQPSGNARLLQDSLWIVRGRKTPEQIELP